MTKYFSNQRNLTRRLRLTLVLFALILMPMGAWADYYDIAIQYGTEESNFHSVLVTENPTDILGDGTMSYDQDNNILTLDRVNVTCTYGSASFIEHCGYWSSERVLTVRLVGSNTVTLGDNSYFFDGTGISFIAADDNASLSIVTQEGRNLDLFPDGIIPTYNNNLSFFPNTSEIKHAEGYNLWICGTLVTDDNKDDILGDGKWSYVHTSGGWAGHELTLKGVTIENFKGNVINSGIDITVKVEQGSTNTISCADGYYPFYSNNGAEFDFDSYLDGSITGTNRKPFSDNSDYFMGGGLEGPTLYFTDAGYTIARCTHQWDVSIHNNYLYDENHANVFGDGAVCVAKNTDDNTVTVTLNGANFRGPLTTEGYTTLYVDLTGINYIRTTKDDISSGYSFYRSYAGDCTITFTGEGELRLIDPAIKNAFTPFVHHYYYDPEDPEGEYSDSLYVYENFKTGGWAKEYVTPTDGSEPYLRIYKGTPTKYNLRIGDTDVTSENASEIFGNPTPGEINGEGTASFAITTDPTTNEEIYTLTLENATIYDYQEWSVFFSYPKLTVHLIGENHIVNGFSYYGQTPDEGTVEFTSDGGEENCLIFDSAESVEDLTNPNYYVGFSHCTYNEISDETGWMFGMYEDPEYHQQHLKLYKRDPSSSTEEKYNLWIGGTQVTERNKTDILGDANTSQIGAGSFQYIPSLNKLFITNNTRNLDIKSEISDSLTIYLAPNSDNDVGNIIYTGNDDAKLIITTDGNYPGTISLSANSNVISGFSSLAMEQNLIIMSPEDTPYDTSNRRLDTSHATIGAPLAPITEEKTIVPKGDELQPESEGGDINKVVDDILYTLSNANGNDGDGYDDGGFIVINSVTTDQQAARVTQDYTPGTNEYLEGFKGLTFMIPAGKGKIAFNVQTSNGHAMKVMVGDAAPVIVESTEKGTVEIPYNVAEPTYVYSYNSGVIGDANSARNVQKGKMTTVHIKIYGTTVKPNKIKSANSAAEASGGEYQGEIIGLEGQEIETDEEIEASKGDVNGDESANIADIVGIVNALMGNHSTMFDKRAADVNSDGIVNAEDLVIIVNKILK